jgi:hypothetical protein
MDLEALKTNLATYIEMLLSEEMRGDMIADALIHDLTSPLRELIDK